jgi:hypothetical protein
MRRPLLLIMLVGLLAVASPSRGDPWRLKSGKGRGGWDGGDAGLPRGRGGIPPGLAKKPYGLPPGQAKKLYGSPYGAGQFGNQPDGGGAHPGYGPSWPPYGSPPQYPPYQAPLAPSGMPQEPSNPVPLPPPVYPAPQPY